MEGCIFCKIASGEIPAEKVFESANVLAFKDINPGAPVHILIIPKKHIASVNDIEDQDVNIIGEIFIAAKKIASSLGVAEDGYRVVTNCGENAGQTVRHLHYHLLGGRSLKWPPG
ncbi:histidine triad nucleotide-binding protein [Clostridium thermarum]|uniref:histidine triad nucleotide-binding protein n=1 Tax=Clostridium thermarum TaxID=1716543 RepID=UPI00111EC249|nr:histidine triad nucleotide-binding protein [Clostridium thermarum]